MLKLKGVSKFYYNKGVVASGFSKIDLNLEIGEFVAITGESGSGKSTLLNVISGLDSYEEGEMYINGEETGYYSESDFEVYRKKYIANIFQNFNLVNSYTVYQNIELVLLINGFKKEEIKNKIDEILKQVDLYKYKNRKASKLSGGQKQRVAIARALAKETPIIVADEPTGNLDSKSASGIMKLLHDISKEKLVIVVTHNYEQVSEYATRKIKMHDGKILEDVNLCNAEKVEDKEYANYGNLSFLNKIKLGLRNTFNIIPKFLLLLIVYLFLTVSVISVYSSIRKSNYDNTLLGYNQFFNNASDKRIVLQKNDKTVFTDLDYENINKISNIDYIFKNDLLLDTYYTLTDEDYYLWGNIEDITTLKDVDEGRMPKDDYEIVIFGSKEDYYLSNVDELFKKEYQIVDERMGDNVLDKKVKIVGIKYQEQTNYSNNKFYVSGTIIGSIQKTINKNYSETETLLNNNLLKGIRYSNQYNIIPSEKVEKGKIIISEDLSYYCKNYYCKNNEATVTIKNLYYTESIELKVSNTFNKNSIERLTGYKDFDRYANDFFINKEDYYSLYDKENYQVSIFIKNEKKVNDTIKSLEDIGYKTLYIKDTLVDYTENVRVFLVLFQLIGIVIALVALFFISYFIIKIILKSRNIYFSTIRMLGASRKDAKMLLNIELNAVLNIAYILVITLVLLVSSRIIKINYVKEIIEYLSISDYVILYIILFVISIFISNRFAKKLFKTSAMNAYREEV